MNVDSKIKNLSPDAQKEAIINHIAYLKKRGGNIAPIKDLFDLDPNKETFKDSKYFKNKNFTIRRLEEALGRRLVASGNFDDYTVKLFYRDNRLSFNKEEGNSTLITKTNFKDKGLLLTSKEGWFDQSINDLQVIAEEAKRRVEMDEFDPFLSYSKNTEEGEKSLPFQITVERNR